MNPPFDRSYWVVPGMFCAGSFPGDREPARLETNMRSLLDRGIRHIINLMERDEVDFSGRLFASYEKTWHDLAAVRGYAVSVGRFPIADMGVPDIGLMKNILDDIDRSMAAALPVFLHCWGGVGRTGTVVGCWLARRGVASGREILTRMNELRRGTVNIELVSPQTGAQRSMILNWRRGE